MKVKLNKYGRILVKFYFTNPIHIPQGINEMFVGSNEERDYNQVAEAAMNGWIQKAEVGRVREGRVDTGENFIPGISSVSLGGGLRQLISGGWCFLTNPHWFKQQPKPYPGKKTRQLKYVVVFNMVREESLPECKNQDGIQEESKSGIRHLSLECNWTLHGWANPDSTVTLNGTRKEEGDGSNDLYFDEELNELGVAIAS